MRYENINTAYDLMIKRDKQFDKDLIYPAEIMLLLFFVVVFFWGGGCCCCCFCLFFFSLSCSAWAKSLTFMQAKGNKSSTTCDILAKFHMLHQKVHISTIDQVLFKMYTCKLGVLSNVELLY